MAAQSLRARIVDIQPHKGGAPGTEIVSIEFDDGDERGPWHQAFALVPKQPLTLDELVVQLVESGMDIHRPDDPFAQLREAMKNKTEFLVPVVTSTLSKQ